MPCSIWNSWISFTRGQIVQTITRQSGKFLRLIKSPKKIRLIENYQSSLSNTVSSRVESIITIHGRSLLLIQSLASSVALPACFGKAFHSHLAITNHSNLQLPILARYIRSRESGTGLFFLKMLHMIYKKAWNSGPSTTLATGSSLVDIYWQNYVAAWGGTSVIRGGVSASSGMSKLRKSWIRRLISSTLSNFFA